ncbi:cytochrome P450 family protein [Microbacterium sp. CPCC 204701]|uniref:cytochrome P450 family protein n=1 Tax=Microbacterium sp. CPCC 204701 TaxID=2493084 RepID=UPI000FDB91C2|nr:cytochrome P450 [Microbacterium sp. CPCC 204701]
MSTQPVDARDVDTTPVAIEASHCPWAGYRKLRERGAVLHTAFPPGLPAYAVTTFNEVVQLLQDPRFSKRFPETEDARKSGMVFSQQGIHLLNTDAPDHTRLRRLIGPAFTPRRIAALETQVRATTNRLIDAIAERDEADLIADFAYPLSITLICEILGIPEEDRAQFREWSVAATTAAPNPNGGPNPGAVALSGYLSELIVRRRAELSHFSDPESAPDVLSRMILSHDSGDGLSDQELIGNAFLLLIAGHETTVGLIGNMLLGLCRRRDQRQLLLDDPELAASAVEEFLRFDGPVQRTTFRTATEDVELGGTVIPKHGQVFAYLGSANHDPQVFENPDEIDITRDIERHVGFGQGIHFCLGSPLARLEARIALQSFLARFPDYALAVPEDELTYLPTVVRALSALPVHLNG